MASIIVLDVDDIGIAGIEFSNDDGATWQATNEDGEVTFESGKKFILNQNIAPVTQPASVLIDFLPKEISK